MATLDEVIGKWMENNQLLTITVNNARNTKLIWGRILNYDIANSLLLIYHDDEKKTYSLKLNEIEDITPANNTLNSATNKHLLLKNKYYQSVYDEVKKIISNLTVDELKAILPLLQHLNKI